MCLRYEFPLSKATGKIRIKERFAFSDYGTPVAPTKTIITHKHYIEWQIGYDRVVNKDENYHFIGANSKRKQIYELSEFLEFGLKNNFITSKDLKKLKQEIQNNKDFIEDREKIMRSNFTKETINNLNFFKSNVSYPLLVHQFSSKDLLCEIIIREKQRAVGVMPMLYFCVSLSSLKDADNQSFVGRQIQSKENGYLEINQQNIGVFLRMFEIFGMLSKVHQYDCMQILNYLIK
ncbi:R.Pab1 family restriction endonuclease [Helicobacter trogontum]|uniref:R.Pab1 family restriction endonuclease n=1 Tax=Helicobacter trogontum TaxID=50960 RepID=A0A4U8SC11_9HELI|nr:R.Pab1 family restriction endonuclease [Helicobacter trogontum]TLD83640.1 R.Pab1 family restriction endonuclease [Helicobacter trogontum]